MGSGAKSYMRKGFLIYEEMRKYFTIYEEAVNHISLCTPIPLNFLLDVKNFLFFFISVLCRGFPAHLYDYFWPVLCATCEDEPATPFFLGACRMYACLSHRLQEWGLITYVAIGAVFSLRIYQSTIQSERRQNSWTKSRQKSSEFSSLQFTCTALL